MRINSTSGSAGKGRCGRGDAVPPEIQFPAHPNPHRARRPAEDAAEDHPLEQTLEPPRAVVGDVAVAVDEAGDAPAAAPAEDAQVPGRCSRRG